MLDILVTGNISAELITKEPIIIGHNDIQFHPFSLEPLITDKRTQTSPFPCSTYI